MQDIFIGVDGGGTKSVIRVEDAAGHLLGRELSGPANIHISAEEAWQTIVLALTKILQSNGLAFNSSNRFHACMGLAGCEDSEAYRAFSKRAQFFTTFLLTSDAHIACIGAHSGLDGAIIVAGTGVVGYQIEKGQITKVGGNGFPQDDEGGGAWLGLEAMKTTLKSLDGRLPWSGLARAVYAYFDYDEQRIVDWASLANSTTFAKLAPMVVEQCQRGDSIAFQIVKQAAKAIDLIAYALINAQQNPSDPPLPFALVGGISNFLVPYLGEQLSTRLRPCQATPDKGAIALLKKEVKTSLCQRIDE